MTLAGLRRLIHRCDGQNDDAAVTPPTVTYAFRQWLDYQIAPAIRTLIEHGISLAQTARGPR